MAQTQSGTVFVGRDRELRELLDALDDAKSGRGRVILLGGEPGIGKSRLADELAIRARDRGCQVLWGHCWEDAGAPAYWPWVQALRAYLRSVDLSEIRRHLGSGARDIALMLPELHDLFSDLPTPSDVAAESARFRLFDSTAALLRNAAKARPMLVVLDDLHAADTPSILLLQFLASQLSEMPLLLVGTYRDIELTPDHALTSAIAELSREPLTRRLMLSGLAVDAVEQFIEAAADARPRRHLVAAIWRETSGNPLFVEEALRLLAAEGHLDQVADLPSLRVAVPAGVRAVIARRIGHLTKASVRTLGLAAALGPEFSLDVLRRIADVAVESDELIEEPLASGLLVRLSGAPGRCRFSHGLVRETLYDEFTPTRRGQLHRRIGQVLEDIYSASIDAHLPELAFHYYEAATAGQENLSEGEGEGLGAKAIDYARRAGDAAAMSLAYEEAARFYRMALAVLNTGARPDDPATLAVLLSLGEANTWAGTVDDARTAFLNAAEIAKRLGAARDLARAALGLGGRHSWTRPGRETALIPLLQEALVMLEGSDKHLRLRLLTRLACAWRATPERRGDSAALSQEAIDIAHALDDAASLSFALAGRFWATCWPENPEERLPIAREIAGIAKSLGTRERIAEAHLLLFLSLTELGRMTEARAESASLIRIVEELRQPPKQWMEPQIRTLLALLSGEFEVAEALVSSEMSSRYRLTPASDDVSTARMHRFLLRREQGRIAEEEASVRASIDDFPWYPVHRAALACLLFDVGEESEAHDVLADLAFDGFRALVPDNEWLLGMCLVGEACALLGDELIAASMYERLSPYAGRHAVGFTEGSVGAVDRYLGLLAATLGRLDTADSHLATAIELNDRMGARPWTAHSQHDLAQVLVRRDLPGDRERARQLDREAFTTAARLGMSLARQVDGQADVGPASSHPVAILSGTCRREGEYWTIEFGLEAFRVRDTKGVRFLASLLAAPGIDVHALELTRLISPNAGAGRTRDSSLSTDGLGDAGPILDAEAKSAYRQRLLDIRVERDEAENWNDPERLARLIAEEEALTHELTVALGMGGRDRAVNSAAERARVSVTRAIRSALLRIRLESPALGEHLEATIRTGTFCSYLPDPRAPITWHP